MHADAPSLRDGGSRRAGTWHQMISSCSSSEIALLHGMNIARHEYCSIGERLDFVIPCDLSLLLVMSHPGEALRYKNSV